MQLSKLYKNSQKLSKRFQKLKYLSLGTNLPALPPISPDKLAQRMIDHDSCLHSSNNQQLLLAQFGNQLPKDGYVEKTNKLYTYFVNRLSRYLHQSKDHHNEQLNIEEKQQKDIRTSNNGHNTQYSRQTNIRLKRNTKPKNSIGVAQQSMIKIYQQADKKHQILKYKISRLEKQIQKLYLDSHQYYVKLMELKSQAQSKKGSARVLQGELQQQSEQGKGNGNQDQSAANCNSNINVNANTNANVYQYNSPQFQQINAKIANIKQLIDKKQQDYQNLSNTQKLIGLEKVGFLKLLLKNGYHQTDGIQWILNKLAKNDVNLVKNDFYDILDATTKQHLLKQYQTIRQQQFHIKKSPIVPPAAPQQPDLKHRKTVRRSHSLHMPLIGYPRIANIPHSGPIIKIYKQAKNYLTDWVRQEKWRTRSLKHRPDGDGHSLRDRQDEWIAEEIGRLRSCYAKQQYQPMLKYMFGSTKYYNRIQYHHKIGHMMQGRKQSSNSFISTSKLTAKESSFHKNKTGNNSSNNNIVNNINNINNGTGNGNINIFSPVLTRMNTNKSNI